MSELLIALAERCEQAIGPDKRLGAEVEIAVRGFPECAYQHRNAMRAKGSPNLDRLEWAAKFFGAGPTGSIDAAVALVPEGWAWTVDGGDPSCDDSASLGLVPMSGQMMNPSVITGAATPALALTAAALRAIAARTS